MIERRRISLTVHNRTDLVGIGGCAPEVEQIEVAKLRPSKTNPRSHSARQLKLLKRSLARFGFINPILADRNNNIVSGHARLNAAKENGMSRVPVLRIEGLSENEIQAYVIADNRLAELADWNRAALAIEIQKLVDVKFELDAIGFEAAEVDIVLDAAREAAPTNGPEEEIPAYDHKSVSSRGSVWQCGKHKIFCGDARDTSAYEALLGGQKAAYVFTDPPYNVKIAGHVSTGKAHPEFAMASGEMSSAEFRSFLKSAFQNMCAHSLSGAVHHICIDWRHLEEILAAGRQTYSELINLCVWCKTTAGMGSLYRSQHELILVWRNGSHPITNNVELGRHGRSRSNVWTYPGANSSGSGRQDLRLHPTVKPVALVADAIKDCSLRGAIVLDPFAGSGTTMIAAEKIGRVARLIEYDPHYVDVAVRRWQAYSGIPAVDPESGLSFEQTEEATTAAAHEKEK